MTNSVDGLTNSVCSHTLLGCVCTHTNSGSSFPEPLQLSLLDCINPRACARAAARDVRCSQLFTVIYISSITVNYCEAVFLLRLVHCVYTAVSLVPRDVSCILWSAHRAPLILSYILYFLCMRQLYGTYDRYWYSYCGILSLSCGPQVSEKFVLWHTPAV